MSWLRWCFVLMLVVLLPLRGAVAAGMLCPPSMAAQKVAVQDVAQAHAAHAPHHAPHHDDQHDHHGTSHSVQDGKCHLCAASCSLTTLLGDAPFVPEPPMATAAAFPALSAPVPSFLSTGQERPPRSI